MASVSDRLAFIVSMDADQAIRAMGKVGDAADKDLSKVDKRLDQLGAQLTKFGAVAVGSAGIAAVGLRKLALGASDINEALQKSEVIFGDASDAVTSFAEDAASSLGLSQQAALDAAGTFGIFGKSAGLTGEDLSGFSNELTVLAADLASFNNTSPEEAIEALGAALRGEAEPIRSYGVLLDDATLKAKALELGIYDGNGALDAQQKILAAQEEILDQTTDAQGDFARTSEGAANQARIFTAELDNFKNNVGQGVLPVFSSLLGAASDTAAAFNSLTPAAQSTIGTFATYATGATGVVGALSLVAGQAIKVRNNFTDIGTDGVRSLNKVGTAAAGIGTAFAAIASYKIAQDVFANLTNSAERAEVAINNVISAAGTGDIDTLVNELGAAAEAKDNFFNLDGFFGGGNDFTLLLGEYRVNVDDFREALEAVTDTDPIIAQDTLDDLREFSGSLEEGTEQQKVLNDEIERSQGVLDSSESAQRALNAAQEESVAASEEAGEGLAGLADDADDAAKSITAVDDAFAALTGQLEGEAARISLADSFDQLRESAVVATADAAAGSDNAAASARDYKSDVNSLIQEVIGYGTEIDDLPEEVVTEVSALLDLGSIDEAERVLTNATRPRTVRISGYVVNVPAIDPNILRLPQRAHGGPVGPGEPYLVGEEGPEIVEFSGRGNVIPADRTKSILSGPVDDSAVVDELRGIASLLSASRPVQNITVYADERQIEDQFRDMQRLSGVRRR